jgi:uncharacterized protein (DUF885 family)
MNKLLTLVLMVYLSACATPRTMEQEGKALNKFFHDEYEKDVAKYPTWQTYLGRKTNYGKLDNETEEFSEKEHQRNYETLSKLRDFDYDNLPPQDQVSYKLLEYQIEREIESREWRYHYFPLNQMFGYQSETPSFMINMHRVDTKSDAEAYISRLKEIRRVFAERMVHLKKQEAKEIYPPKFVFSKVIDDSKNIINGKPFTKSKKDSPLLADFKKKAKKLKIKRSERNKLIKQAESALLSHVLPAYSDLITYVKHLDKKVTASNGAWSLPDGEDYYNYMLRGITTTNLTAKEIHDIGLKEVKRIHGEMDKIRKKVGFKKDLKAFFKYMKSKRFLYPQNKAGRDAYLKDAKKVIAKMKKALPKIFNTFPKAKLKVKAVEAFREKSAGIAFYQGPSMDGKRPGIYYVNLYKMEDNPKYKLEALAYHEAIPGHHMQIAIAKELKELPMFRRTGGYTAYAEGWGLYSELLPKEIGFYKDPYSDFGRLSMELWRATRLVVDTGIHAKKWTREYAIQYLKDNTPNSDLEIMKGIERYFIMPGQATAYKIGMLKILELRAKAKQKLGPKFDIRDFHDIVLRDGAVPLFVLEDKVNSWIQAKN